MKKFDAINAVLTISIIVILTTIMSCRSIKNKENISTLNQNMVQLHLNSDSIEIENRVIKDVYLKTEREKELQNLSNNEVSRIIANLNNTIGFVKLDSAKNIKMLRCKMISIRRDDPQS